MPMHFIHPHSVNSSPKLNTNKFIIMNILTLYSENKYLIGEWNIFFYYYEFLHPNKKLDSFSKFGNKNDIRSIWILTNFIFCSTNVKLFDDVIIWSFLLSALVETVQKIQIVNQFANKTRCQELKGQRK